MDDETETDPKESEASKHNLQYIALDGNIACMGKTQKENFLQSKVLKKLITNYQNMKKFLLKRVTACPKCTV